MFTKAFFSFDAFSRIPIKRKLILLMMAVAVVSVVLTTLSSTLFGVMYIKQNEKKELMVLASVIGDKNAAALAFGNPELTRVNLTILASKPSIRQACIFNAGGDVFAEYPFPSKLTMLCPGVEDDKVEIKNQQVKLYRSIYKKGEYLGSVYIESDLRAVDRYLAKQILVSLAIISGICLISYLITLHLQRVISNPIKALSEDVKAIFNEDYSIRTRAVYYDELGDIAESFNKILEEREQNHKTFFKKAQQYDHISKSAEKTLATLDDEAVYPFKAAATFKSLLEKEVFGPVNPMYHDYFNDVYTAEVQLYYVLAKALDSLRLQSSLLTSEKEGVDLSALVETMVADAVERLGDPRFSYSVTAEPGLIYEGYRQPLVRFIENITALFLEVKGLGRLYECTFDVSGEEGRFHLNVIMQEKGIKAQPCNDNFLTLSLKALIHKLKHNEPLSPMQESYCVKLEDVDIRSRLYSIEFLSNINQAEVEVQVSPNVLGISACFASMQAKVDEGFNI